MAKTQNAGNITPLTPQTRELLTEAKLLNAKTLGIWLNLSKRQIARLNACGRIPRPIKIGGSVRYNAEEAEAWVRSGCPDRETWEAMKMQAESY